MNISALLLSFLLLFLCGSIECQIVNDTDFHVTLLEKLFNKYNKQVKPKEQVNVSIELSLVQIVAVSEKDQTITLSTWIAQSWVDPRLSWIPSAYDNITYLAVPSDKIWM